ncbi:MAG: DNA polymerase III subunit gamma/tau [Deltaproteobacteria bacterium]|jgi:DNA polymerase-3 subunit gamma/tau|nr:DNA polymerase III subunit gamma/tau [Deltaproteobacteria bacterium]
MSYLVMARKYRPRTFSDLVGQGQVTRTLTQALKTGRVAHAYLFTGPRGVGKTTAARLLAAALSCESEGERPCGVCPRCVEIQSGRSVDVVEMDGASNRGISEIRDLRDTVKFQPAKNRFKVYIIDEVHALTPDAFNALLKTLEEPPSHVIFVFATTEAHKVPATILSRCQRYDFRRIRVEDIASRLKDVAEAEGLAWEQEALTAMARQAEGGLRDALGLADQVAASEGELTLAAVTRSLGLIQRELVSRLALAAFRGDAADALNALKDAYETGSDFKELGLRTLEYVRDLALFKASPKAAEMLDLTDVEERDFAEASKPLSLSEIHRHFESWLRLYGELARHPQPRWLLESHLIRLSQAGKLDGLADLTARLAALLESDPASVTAAFAARPASSGARGPSFPGAPGTAGVPGAPGMAQMPGAAGGPGAAPHGYAQPGASAGTAGSGPSGIPADLPAEMFADDLPDDFRDDAPPDDFESRPVGPLNPGQGAQGPPVQGPPGPPAAPAGTGETLTGAADAGAVASPAAAPHSAAAFQARPALQPSAETGQGSFVVGPDSPGQASLGHPFPGQASHGQPLPGQAPHGQPLPGQASRGHPLPSQAPHGQPLPGQASHDQPLSGQASHGQLATARSYAAFSREDGLKAIDSIKKSDEGAELMRRLPGTFIGYDRSRAEAFAPAPSRPDQVDAFYQEDEDRFSDEDDSDASFAEDGDPDAGPPEDGPDLGYSDEGDEYGEGGGEDGDYLD